MEPLHFILIGNYLPDAQESMLRFAEMLAKGLKNSGLTVEIISPGRILLGKNARAGRGIGKWLGYMDKWILFPIALRQAVKKNRRLHGESVRYHICDHSNAPYLAHLPAHLTGITCHDVLAIRGALGYPEAYCQASRMGVLLQRWILKNLCRATRIACVSNRTLEQLCEVAGEPKPKAGWKVIPNAFNAEFSRMETSEAVKVLKKNNIPLFTPFLLHVGSDLPRKNRRMLLQMVSQKNQPWPGHIYFAGHAIDPALAAEINSLGMRDRVHSVVRPNHETLCALYSLADAFIFPSFSEGFGWPLIEAQACGAPVIASDLEPLPEVSGGGAFHASPHNPQAFAAALHELENDSEKAALVNQGYANASRFGLTEMIESYLALYGFETNSRQYAASKNS